MSKIGRRLKICGLKSRNELNGGEGVVLEELLNGRLRVLMTNFSNLVISVGNENPLFIQHSGAKADTSDTVLCLAAGTNVKIWQNIGYF